MGIARGRLVPDAAVVVTPPIDVVDPPELDDRVVDEETKVVGSPELVLSGVVVEVGLEVEVVLPLLILFKQARSGRTRMASFNCLKVEKLLQLSLRQLASIW